MERLVRVGCSSEGGRREEVERDREIDESGVFVRRREEGGGREG
jgi:hypothetical protein